MIFFRSQTVRLCLQKDNVPLSCHVKLTAFYSAPVDPQSGMTVNLKDVDAWLAQALAKVKPSFISSEEFIRSIFSVLKKMSPYLVKVKVAVTEGAASVEFDGINLSRHYSFRTWFKQGNGWTQRLVRLQIKKRLSPSWRRKIRLKKWSNPRKFADLLKKAHPEVQVLEVQNPEWNGLEKFNF